MCVVIPHLLAREPAARSRCIPPAPGDGWHPAHHQPNVSPFDPSQGLEICLSTCTAPCTIDWPIDRHSREPPRSPENPMASVLPLNHKQGEFRSPCTHQPKSLRAPWNPDQPCADWIPSGLSRPEPRPRAIAPLDPASRAWRIPSPPAPGHGQTVGCLIAVSARPTAR